MGCRTDVLARIGKSVVSQETAISTSAETDRIALHSIRATNSQPFTTHPREASWPRGCRSYATVGANMRFGKSASGNTPFAMTAISSAAPTTFISTRSSIDWCSRPLRGRFPRCIDMPAPACSPRIGEAVARRIMQISVSARINPDCVEPVSGRRFAPTRWLHPGYEFPLSRRSSPPGRRRAARPASDVRGRCCRSPHIRRRDRPRTARRYCPAWYSASASPRSQPWRCKS